jgi:hypothetical protein
MRNVVLGLGVTLDSYIARRAGAVDFLFMPRDFSMADFFASVDTAIMGRKTLDAGPKRKLRSRLSDRFFVGLKPTLIRSSKGIDLLSTPLSPQEVGAFQTLAWDGTRPRGCEDGSCFDGTIRETDAVPRHAFCCENPVPSGILRDCCYS